MAMHAGHAHYHFSVGIFPPLDCCIVGDTTLPRILAAADQTFADHDRRMAGVGGIPGTFYFADRSRGRRPIQTSISS